MRTTLVNPARSGAADVLVRVGCYCRISSDPNDKREGGNRRRQDTAALCEVKGWQVAGVYIDSGADVTTSIIGRKTGKTHHRLRLH